VAHISELNMFAPLRWDKGIWRFEALQNSILRGNERTSGITWKSLSGFAKNFPSVFNIVQTDDTNRGIF